MPALTVAAHTYTVTALSRREVVRRAARCCRPRRSRAPPRSRSPPRPRCGRAARPPPGARLLPGGLAGWYAATYGAAQLRALSEPSASNMRAAVGAGITGLPALQGALIARSGRPAAALAVAAAAPLGRRLARWMSPT